MKSNAAFDHRNLREINMSSKVTSSSETKYGIIFIMKARVKKQAAC